MTTTPITAHSNSTVRFCVDLEAELHARFTAEAARRGMTKAALARERFEEAAPCRSPVPARSDPARVSPASEAVQPIEDQPLADSSTVFGAPFLGDLPPAVDKADQRSDMTLNNGEFEDPR